MLRGASAYERTTMWAFKGRPRCCYLICTNMYGTIACSQFTSPRSYLPQTHFHYCYFVYRTCCFKKKRGGGFSTFLDQYLQPTPAEFVDITTARSLGPAKVLQHKRRNTTMLINVEIYDFIIRCSALLTGHDLACCSILVGWTRSLYRRPRRAHLS